MARNPRVGKESPPQPEGTATAARRHRLLSLHSLFETHPFGLSFVFAQHTQTQPTTLFFNFSVSGSRFARTRALNCAARYKACACVLRSKRNVNSGKLIILERLF